MRYATKIPGIAITSAVFQLLSVPTCMADRVDVTVGGTFAGPTRLVDGEATSKVMIKLDDDLVVALPRSRVRIQEDKKLRQYRVYASKVGEDADRHHQLAVWCKGQSRQGVPMYEQYHYHLQRAIAINPNHRAARIALRYQKVDGKWIKAADFKRRHGLIHVGGTRWEVPEIQARRDRREAEEKQAKQWRPKLRRMLNSIRRNGAEAMAEIRGIVDPLATDAIAEQLEKSRGGGQSRELRLTWVRLLGRLGSGSAVRALVKAGLVETDRVVRDAALEQLQTTGRGAAIATYTKVLRDAAAGKHSDDRQVNRAAIGLQSFADPEQALTYVDALVTEHVKVKPAGPAMNFGFGNNGVQGMQTGGQPQADVKVSQNTAVLSLLKKIEPDASFGFNEDRWRHHFASRRGHYRGDLRRDP